MSKLLDASAKGVFPISVTPFHDEGTIDFTSMDRLTDYFVTIGFPASRCSGSWARQANCRKRSRSARSTT